MLVLELIRRARRARDRRAADCDDRHRRRRRLFGQVLVLHDMLDVFPGKKPRFVRNFMTGAPDIATAVRTYVRAVKERASPPQTKRTDEGRSHDRRTARPAAGRIGRRSCRRWATCTMRIWR